MGEFFNRLGNTSLLIDFSLFYSSLEHYVLRKLRSSIYAEPMKWRIYNQVELNIGMNNRLFNKKFVLFSDYSTNLFSALAELITITNFVQPLNVSFSSLTKICCSIQKMFFDKDIAPGKILTKNNSKCVFNESSIFFKLKKTDGSSIFRISLLNCEAILTILNYGDNYNSIHRQRMGFALGCTFLRKMFLFE